MKLGCKVHSKTVPSAAGADKCRHVPSDPFKLRPSVQKGNSGFRARIPSLETALFRQKNLPARQYCTAASVFGIKTGISGMQCNRLFFSQYDPNIFNHIFQFNLIQLCKD